jgi:elongation factor Ts
MAEITAAQVKELRDATNVSMMECKKALMEAGGDKDAAMRLLRERGLAIAGKRAERTANQGLVAAEVLNGGKTGVMVEVNCETDFVARNESFQAFVGELLVKARDHQDGELAEAVKDQLMDKVAAIGENLVIRRNVRYDVQGEGAIASYIHLGGKIGILLEVGCEKAETTSKGPFLDLVKDITLHIAASNPSYLNRTEVPQDVVDSEKAIFAKQVEGKPAQIIDKIVAGKVDKFFGQVCLLEQGFVKEPDQTITQLLETQGKAMGDSLSIRRYVRYQIGA